MRGRENKVGSDYSACSRGHHLQQPPSSSSSPPPSLRKKLQDVHSFTDAEESLLGSDISPWPGAATVDQASD